MDWSCILWCKIWLANFLRFNLKIVLNCNFFFRNTAFSRVEKWVSMEELFELDCEWIENKGNIVLQQVLFFFFFWAFGSHWKMIFFQSKNYSGRVSNHWKIIRIDFSIISYWKIALFIFNDFSSRMGKKCQTFFRSKSYFKF